MKNIDDYCFSFKDKIRQGSQTQVYIATKQKTGEKVTIKWLNKTDIRQDDKLMEGFRIEIQTYFKILKSPNILAVFDAIETMNSYYIIQEYWDGGDLEELLKKQKLLSEKDAIKFLVDILNGFTQLIKNGIIHKNLKPENILIDKQTYKITNIDFVERGNCIIQGTLVGTPLYMSPQTLDLFIHNAKSDVWSLGIILYEVLFGKTPWTGKSPIELLQSIKTQPLKFPTDNNQVSLEIQDLIIGCLQVDESKRLSWEEIYKHPAVSQYFTDFNLGNIKLEEKDTQQILQKEMDQLKIDSETAKDKDHDAKAFSKTEN
ncbi:unnamed protein product [Paramecium octaurelia]|uniref:Protein kinase domain-containing protein n=1 Tax=Paramecium octaurelia TaxID=43137 RepID=A0A8S1VQ30_PAROT|nr:unnamed protein product [Paramecium octaurelia]